MPEAAAAREAVAKKIAEFGREPFLNAMRVVLLQTIDTFWVEHLEVMDYTRSSVNLRAFGQRDPLIEYKKEGLRLYKEMQAAMQGQVLRMIPNIVPVQAGQGGVGGQSMPQNPVAPKEVTPTAIQSGGGAPGSGEEPGRNDPCWCGSGKKYKKCHGAGK
jgi:preprotein translocase subunit SecA